MTDRELERQVADNPNSVSDGMGIYRERLGDDLERQVAEALKSDILHPNVAGVEMTVAGLNNLQAAALAPRIAAALRAVLSATANDLYTITDNCDCESCTKKKNTALAAGLAALKGKS